MTSETVFFTTQSIFAILGSLFIIFLIVLLIFLFLAIKRVDKKAEEMIAESKAATAEAREMVNKIGQGIMAYLLAKLKKVINK